MDVQFNAIPGNLRVPLWHAEINAAQTPYQTNARLLLIAQYDESVGTVTPEEPHRVFTGHRGMYGPNSMMTSMYETARRNAPYQEIWGMVVKDDVASVKATGEVAVRTSTAVRVHADAPIGGLAAAAPLVVDGITLAGGDLVLVTAQAAADENGIYEVLNPGTGADGAWARAAVMDVNSEVYTGRTFFVREGNVYAATSHEVTSTNAPHVLGTDAMAFGALAGLHQPIVGNTTLSLYIAGYRVRTVAFTTDTAAQLAARLNAAIAASDDPIPAIASVGVNAGVDDHKVLFTARHGGATGNSIRMELNYYGQEGPTSAYCFDITQMAGGTGDPDITTALGNLGTDEFDWIGSPYSDDVNVRAAGLMLNAVSGRWGPLQQLYGHYITARNDTSAALAAYGETHNDPHYSIMGVYNFLSPVWDVAASVAALAAAHLQDAPELSRPLQTLDMIGILGPKSPADRFNVPVRQSLYFDGISGYHISKDGTVSIDRLITTYQTNEWGSNDAAWLDVNTIAQAMYGIRYLRAKITGTYPRSALMDENPGGIIGVATPADLRRTTVHGYKELSLDGVYENVEEFQQRLIVERDRTVATRVNWYLPVDNVNQFRIAAVNYVSHLQYGERASQAA